MNKLILCKLLWANCVNLKDEWGHVRTLTGSLEIQRFKCSNAIELLDKNNVCFLPGPATYPVSGVHTGGGGGKTWDIPPPPPPPPQSYMYFPPPPQEFSQPNYSRMFCACANYFRMAISTCTSRMPQNQSQSIYFSNFLGACSQTPHKGRAKARPPCQCQTLESPPQTQNPV